MQGREAFVSQWYAASKGCIAKHGDLRQECGPTHASRQRVEPILNEVDDPGASRGSGSIVLLPDVSTEHFGCDIDVRQYQHDCRYERSHPCSCHAPRTAVEPEQIALIGDGSGQHGSAYNRAFMQEDD